MTQRSSRHSLPQDFIDSFKRDRAARALSEAVREEGLRGLSVESITHRARMARATFYSLFQNREAAIAYAAKLGNQRLKLAIDGAVALAGPPWQKRFSAVIQALLDEVEKDPCLAELSLVHAAGAKRGQVPFDPALVQTLAGIFRPVRRSAPKPGPGPLTEELLAYSILCVIAERLRRRELEDLGELGPELTMLVVSVFSGPEAKEVSA